MNVGQRLMAARPARAALPRRVDSTTPTEVSRPDRTLAARRRGGPLPSIQAPAPIPVPPARPAYLARDLPAVPERRPEPTPVPPTALLRTLETPAPGAVPPAPTPAVTRPQIALVTSAPPAQPASPATGHVVRRERVRDDAEQGAVIEATPEPARGPVRLAPSALVVAQPQAEFDAPSNLDVAPERPPDPRREPPTPEFLKHRDVFANAVRAARALYSALLSDGGAHIEAGIAAAQVLADRRQRDLDVGLADLGQGLEQARGLLAFRTQMTLDLLSARAAAARVRVGRAAGSALATLHAARERIDTQLVTPRTDRGTIVSTARTAQSNVTAQGQAAQRALRNLSARANQEFPAAGVPLESAENEAIALRLPDRATRRTGALSTEQTAQEAFLRSSFATLDEDFQRAFADADRILARAGTEGPAAVRRTHAATLRQLDRALRQMRRSIREAGASSDAAIVRQHDAARARLVSSAEGRERSETQAVQQRLSREAEAASGVAGAQGKAVRAVVDGLGARAPPTSQRFRSRSDRCGDRFVAAARRDRGRAASAPCPRHR